MAPLDARLAERARTHAALPFLRLPEGARTFAEADAEATRLAHGLARLGVRPATQVATLLPNCLEAALLPFAVARRGAVLAPVNTAFRGGVLAHVLDLSRAELLVMDDSLADALAAVAPELTHLRRVVVRGDAGTVRAALPGLEVVPLEVLRDAPAAPPAPPNAEDDLAMLLFTSGTTGRSKGCMLTHRYGPRQAQLMIEHYGLRADDVLYSPFPLFHLDALVLTVLAALELGATAAIGARFSVSRFWDEIRASGATVFDFMGATLTLLHKAPPQPDDGDNTVRLAWGVPVPAWAPAFEARFGLRVAELYGSTDVGVPVYQPLDAPRVPGSCGRPIAAYDVRLAGDDGAEVAAGVPGEILVRPREPGLANAGYFGMPEATAAAWRDGWFHTGDLATRDAGGNLFFAGRRKEVIRRRGENISALEVEEVVLDHPDVLDAAAYGVPSELSEEEVMVAVVPRPGRSVDPADLVRHCAGRMAAYMTPRYVDVVDALPVTPTEKVEKYRLIERGVTPTTWDRDA
ncbi:MAG: AMP-binding protein [Solirubrobacteraceae bacterium]